MQELGPAQPAPTLDELIRACSEAISVVQKQEISDDSDSDRMFLLRVADRNYRYYRDLQNYSPAFYQGLIDYTGIAGMNFPDQGGFNGVNDYSQNLYRGYCRKFEALLGTRMPNAIAIPNNPDDEEAIAATISANAGFDYLREECDLQGLLLKLTFILFNFGPGFFHMDWVVDGEKYGFKAVPKQEAENASLGDAAFTCVNCAASYPVQDPANPMPPEQCEGCGAPMGQESFRPATSVSVPNGNMEMVAKGAFELTLHDLTEISVPLDAANIDECEWLRWEREKNKGKLLLKYGDKLRKESPDSQSKVDETTASVYGESIRSAMSSPIGLVRPKKATRWTETDTWWTPCMYELVEDKTVRETLKQNFPSGLRITAVKGIIVDLREEKLSERWQEAMPEPAKSIMADPLGNDWIEPQDISTNILNQCDETVQRQNEPGFADPTRIDFDAYQDHQSQPGDLFPAIAPAGKSLSDIIFRPPPVKFSEQIMPFGQSVEERAKNISGLTDPVWGGGDSEEPTARQAELKKNAALMQLSVPWKMIGKAIEKVAFKAMRLIGQYEDGILEFSKKDQFGQFEKMQVIAKDLKTGKFHFEADEAIPLSWGQKRDNLMWFLEKSDQIQDKWGMNDPLNIFDQKQLLGMTGERTPHLDDREKGMKIISRLLKEQMTPGQPDPANPETPAGPPTPSVEPKWEDDHAFMSALVKAYLNANPDLEQMAPDGYLNVVAWGQAQERMANQPPPPEPPKTNISLALKGPDLGDPAVQAAVTGAGFVPQGTPVAATLPPVNGMMPPPTGQPGMTQ